MDVRNEVILRQRQLFQDSVLLAGLVSDELLTQLPNSTAWCWLLNDFQRLHQRFNNRVYFSTTVPSIDYKTAILFLLKSKELTHYLLQSLASQLKLGDVLYLVGEKKAGVESAAKQLAHYGSPVKLDSARHCQLWKVTMAHTVEITELNSLQQTYELSERYNHLIIKTLPGVFSHGRLDQGTALLLEHLTGLPKGDMLDFGCGAGVIGSYLKKQYPTSTVYLQDIDAFALASSKLTLQANQVDAVVLEGNGIEQSPKGLAAIISNPPFHQGINTYYQTSEQLLQQAVKHLAKQGELRLVANSFLKYQEIILKSFGNCHILAKAGGFTVYSAHKL